MTVSYKAEGTTGPERLCMQGVAAARDVVTGFFMKRSTF